MIDIFSFFKDIINRDEYNKLMEFENFQFKQSLEQKSAIASTSAECGNDKTEKTADDIQVITSFNGV